MTKVKSIVLLTRWQEYVYFVVPLTLTGFLITNTPYASKLVAVLIGNLLTTAFAFIINDVEDAEDDKAIPAKLTRNPISSGELSRGFGYLVSVLVASGAFLAFYSIGGLTTLLGSFNILLAYIYSSKAVRLKKWPLVDIVSHAMMLGGLLILTSFYTFSNNIGPAFSLVMGVFFISSYGQIYNQIRDFEADKKAGLKNTTILLGKNNSLHLARLFLVAGLLSLITALLLGVVPIWLVVVLPLAMIFAVKTHTKLDISGRATIDRSGDIQIPGYLAINIAVFVWFVSAVVLASN